MVAIFSVVDPNGQRGYGLTPYKTESSPSERGRSPERRGRTPDGQGRSPDGRGRSPDGQGRSPDGRGRSPDGRGRSPDGRGRSPDGRGRDRRSITRILRGLLDRCVQLYLVSGRSVAGFVMEVEDGVVRLSVRGRPVFVAIENIEQIQETFGAAC